MQANVSKPVWSIGADGARISFLVPSGEDARRICDGMKDGKTYEMTVKEKKKKRSLDANALMWAVIGDMAKILQKSDPKIYPEEIYRQYIRHTGNFSVAEVWADDYQKLIDSWQSNGIGWIAEKVDIVDSACGMYKFRVHLFYGSSQYDTQQMAQLIDMVLQDAAALGIDTANDSFRALIEQYPMGQ